MYSLIGMKCRGRGLGPQALHGFKKKTNWVKKFIEVFGRVLPSEKFDVSKGPSIPFSRGLLSLHGAHTI